VPKRRKYRSLGRQMLRVALLVSASYLVLVAFFLVVSRSRVRPVMDVVRVFDKRVLNPAMMMLAGRRRWYASVLRHKGRRSGKEYATPVVAVPARAPTASPRRTVGGGSR
jgi:hypothetical protein